MALPAEFEPATLGLEIRCSIQLSYGSKWSPREELNLLPQLYKNRALTDELLGEKKSRLELPFISGPQMVLWFTNWWLSWDSNPDFKDFKSSASAVGLESHDIHYRVGVGKVKPQFSAFWIWSSASRMSSRMACTDARW